MIWVCVAARVAQWVVGRVEHASLLTLLILKFPLLFEENQNYPFRAIRSAGIRILKYMYSTLHHGGNLIVSYNIIHSPISNFSITRPNQAQASSHSLNPRPDSIPDIIYQPSVVLARDKQAAMSPDFVYVFHEDANPARISLAVDPGR